MSVEATHRIEQAKWDELATQRLPEASERLPYADLADYARWSPGLAGVTEFVGDISGKRVLEYGCGMGKLTVMLARSGAQVTAFDLSPMSIEMTRRRLSANDTSATTLVAAGEKLPFDDGEFEVVIGESVLHHLHALEAAPELWRVIRPGGRAAFAEPLGMNPLLSFARDHVPYRSKAPRGADVPLSYADIDAWSAGFTHSEHREVQLLSMVERFGGYDTEIGFLRRWDGKLLDRWPALRRYCRYVAMRMVR
jgi:2-polyprenyl-3-methyl-5-hydroxy-6-metoxy-1,4-benzoquinol methylase